jgi:hypothetical protein
MFNLGYLKQIQLGAVHSKTPVIPANTTTPTNIPDMPITAPCPVEAGPLAAPLLAETTADPVLVAVVRPPPAIIALLTIFGFPFA